MLAFLSDGNFWLGLVAGIALVVVITNLDGRHKAIQGRDKLPP